MDYPIMCEDQNCTCIGTHKNHKLMMFSNFFENIDLPFKLPETMSRIQQSFSTLQNKLIDSFDRYRYANDQLT
jgi:hypothetical protein